MSTFFNAGTCNVIVNKSGETLPFLCCDGLGSSTSIFCSISRYFSVRYMNTGREQNQSITQGKIVHEIYVSIKFICDKIYNNLLMFCENKLTMGLSNACRCKHWTTAWGNLLKLATSNVVWLFNFHEWLTL